MNNKNELDQIYLSNAKNIYFTTVVMVNGKIILGTLSIIASLVVFFEIWGDILSGIDYVPITRLFVIISLGILGITFVRSGISNKRKTS